ASSGWCLTTTEGHGEGRAQLPVGVGIGIHLAERCAEVFAEAVHAIKGVEIELRQEAVLRDEQLLLSNRHVEALADEVGLIGERVFEREIRIDLTEELFGLGRGNQVPAGG